MRLSSAVQLYYDSGDIRAAHGAVRGVQGDRGPAQGDPAEPCGAAVPRCIPPDRRVRCETGAAHQQAPECPPRTREESGHPGRADGPRLAGLQRPPRGLSREVRLRRAMDREGPRGRPPCLRDRGADLQGGASVNPPKIDRAIDALRKRLAREPQVQSAVIYGSCARGTAREESDVDVLLLV